MKRILIVFLVSIGLFACKKEIPSDVKLLDTANFVTQLDGKDVALYNLTSGNGVYMQVTNLGGRVVTLWTPDRNGKYEDIVLGYDNIDSYIHYKGERFLGPVVGRYANRIAKGEFTLDSVTYKVPVNNNGQSLHGGIQGLDLVVWNVASVNEHEIKLTYVSPDGEEGYPGTVNYEMTYTLTPRNEFKIVYTATTDKATVINLSHHGVFNLRGEGNGTILNHVLTLNADFITPVDSVLIPTGEILPVDSTPFDFRTATPIGERIEVENQQLKNGSGYDHNWVVSKENLTEIKHDATVFEPEFGRVMEVWSDQPGIQFYSGNFFDGKVKGKYGKLLSYREGLALETQKFPDSPNHPQFPSTRLNPGETYTQTCIYKFSTK
ncbi:MAG: aldose epimerase family protein [Paludibacteraceae bacterium]